MALAMRGVMLLALHTVVIFSTCKAFEFYSIGGIFDDGPPPNPERMIFVQSAIRNNIRSNSSAFRPFHAAARLQHTKLANNAAVLRKMCVLLAYNVSLTVGVVDLDVVNMVATTSKKIQLPFITPSFGLLALPPLPNCMNEAKDEDEARVCKTDVAATVSGLNPSSLNLVLDSFSLKESFPDMEFDYVVSLRPSLVQPLLDLLDYNRWGQFAYIYDGKRGIRRADTFMQIFSRYNYDVTFKHLVAEEPITDTLKNMRDSGRHHIIFDLSLEASENALRKLQANDLGMVTASYHYIFMDLDFGEIDMNQFQLGGFNLTGFRLLDKESDAYQDFIMDWRSYVKNSSYIEVDINYFHLSNPAISVDMMDVALEALDMFRVDQRNSVRKKEKAKSCNLGMSSAPVPNSNGPNLIEIIKKVKLQGLTGNIEFDNRGDRTNYSVQILGLRQMSLEKVGTWNGQNENRLTFDTFTEDETPTDVMSGRSFTITSILSPPFMMLKKDADERRGNDRYEGYCVDLLKEVVKVYRSKHSTFKYKIKLVSDGEYGAQMVNGKWNGMIGELMYGKADIAAAPLTINVQRERVVGFTKPFMGLGVSIMIKKPQDNQPGVFTFMQPLAPEIWMSIAFACVIVSVVLFQVSRFSPKEWHRVEHPPPTPSGTGEFNLNKPDERFVTEDVEETENDFGIFNSLWFTVGALMQQGCELCPRSFSGRVTGSVWWFFTLILVSSYTANLAAFLTAKRMVMPISSAGDLVGQTAITYGILASGSTETFFKTSTVPVYRHMWEFMANSEDAPFANTTQEGVERVRKSNGKYAFLMESAMNDYYSQQPPCDTMRAGNLLDSKSYGIGVNKQLVDVRELLTLAILELQEQAILNKLEKRWWTSKNESCRIPTIPDHMTKTSALNLETLAGIFYILLGGLAVALLVAGGNLFWRSRHEIIAAKSQYIEQRKARSPEMQKKLPANSEAKTKKKRYSHASVSPISSAK